MGWDAELLLVYKKNTQRSYLSRIRHRGPLVVQKSFYPGDGRVVHNYLLHPPGGLVGGDRLEMQFQVGQSAAALVTTPAAGKIYRTLTEASAASLKIKLERESEFYWLPLENIAYNGAHHDMRMQVDLDENAKFSGWDILCLGRPGAHEIFDVGRIDTSVALQQNSKPIIFERMCWQGSSNALTSVWGLNTFPVLGSLYIYRPEFPPMDDFIGDLSEPNLELGGTLRSNWYILRARGLCPIRIREKFWHIVERLHKLGSTASLLPPTIWNY
jgi:urease accessory protein